MELIARGQPRAKLDESGEVIELRVPTGDREHITFDITPNQALMLEHQLGRAIREFFVARKEAADWRAENVLPFKRAALSCA
jgi:hypothetical protein